MMEQQKCNFFLLRYVPDAVKNEFVNVGLVLLPSAGPPQLRFTRDWSRVRCLDPDADFDLLESLENDLRDQMQVVDGGHDSFLRKIQESFSNALQPSEFKPCLAEVPAAEADVLARLYLERPSRREPREMSARQEVFVRMRQAFENAGAWSLVRKEIKAADYTRRGDPLKIDCGYASDGSVKLFHALALPGDVNATKVLAFSFPPLAEGIRKKEGRQVRLTAVTVDELARNEDSVGFALETLTQQGIQIAALSQMPSIASLAARELGVA